MGNSRNEVAIKVSNIHKTFRIPLEGGKSIKQRIVNFASHKKGYREFSPLDGISFEINKGEFFGIVGRNGSGKSTLLKTIAGIYSPDGGYVTVNGTLVPFIELGVGFNPELTGRENVQLNGALLGFSRNEMDAMYDDIVEFAELKDFMDERLKNYSSGMQVRLAFSIAIRAQGDILLLDEVLAVGDAAFQQKCFDYFEKLKDEHRTIVLVTHNMNAVKRFCTRALLIEDGNIKLVGSPEEVADQYTVDNVTAGKKKKATDNEVGFNDEVKRLDIEPIIKDQLTDKDELRFRITYETDGTFSPGFAFSIVHGGLSVAEMNSTQFKIPTQYKSSGVVEFTTPVDVFNPDTYRVDVSMIDVSNRRRMAYKKNAFNFVVAGIDETRGGAIKLEAGKWHVASK